VVVSDTATTRAPESSRTPGCGTYFRLGVSSSSAGFSSASRRSACDGQASSTETAVELACADTSLQISAAGTSGLIRASSEPYDSIRTMSERHISRRLSPYDSTVVPSADSVTSGSAYAVRLGPRRPVLPSIVLT
jgi:hypothetical protein